MFHTISAETRGKTQIGWLDSRHSFSFGEYHDPARMGFGPLRVINDDRITGGSGFPMHGHANMEIITIMLSGALAHRDSLGNGSVISPGEVQLMRAGSGIRHSEFNSSATDPAHLLQIWVMPNVQNAAPSYQQERFDVLDPAGPAAPGWHTLVAPGTEGALHILQDARLLAARIGAETPVSLTPQDKRRYWLQVMSGAVRVTVPGETAVILAAGDALALENETRAADIEYAPAAGETEARVLLFDLIR